MRRYCFCRYLDVRNKDLISSFCFIENGMDCYLDFSGRYDEVELRKVSPLFKAEYYDFYGTRLKYV